MAISCLYKINVENIGSAFNSAYLFSILPLNVVLIFIFFLLSILEKLSIMHTR